MPRHGPEELAHGGEMSLAGGDPEISLLQPVSVLLHVTWRDARQLRPRCSHQNRNYFTL